MELEDGDPLVVFFRLEVSSGEDGSRIGFRAGFETSGVLVDAEAGLDATVGLLGVTGGADLTGVTGATG